jgi:gamma-glutamyltranspeptidase / glutathione hydrolase
MFTTRPEIRGTFGVVASTHWIASSVGMAMLERGGNAFDAAVAIGFVLQIVEPHLCGPAGEVPIIFKKAGDDQPQVLCGQGVAPQAATIERMRELNLDMVPGSGLISAVVPGAFDAWMTLLRDHGSLRLAAVMEPAIQYAGAGHPLLPGASRAIVDVADAFRNEWPTSASVWLPDNQPPQANQLFRQPALAATWRRVLSAAGEGTREQQIERARAAWSTGFVAEAVDRFCRTQELMDASGRRHKGLLTGDDMARWSASYEAPQTFRYRDWMFFKTGPWGQGPVLLQALSLLKGFDLAQLPEPEFVHVVLEAIKLAFADREAYYGDPAFTRVPLDALLGESYAAERRKLIGKGASQDLRPGELPGFEAQVRQSLRMLRIADSDNGRLGVGEPTMMHLKPTLKPGDTVHFDVIDRHGNMVTATPSGGWPQSSPTIPELGFALNTRAQMFWLDPGLPGSLAPGKRPRTTLTPTLAIRDDGSQLICGTPGGDQQDQWQLILLLRHIHHGLDLQQSIDAPLFHSVHFPASFYPREAMLGTAVVEESWGDELIAELRRRGHNVKVAPQWSAGRLTAAVRGSDGILRAAATPRLMQAYAVGR